MRRRRKGSAGTRAKGEGVPLAAATVSLAGQGRACAWTVPQKKEEEREGGSVKWGILGCGREVYLAGSRERLSSLNCGKGFGQKVPGGKQRLREPQSMKSDRWGFLPGFTVGFPFLFSLVFFWQVSCIFNKVEQAKVQPVPFPVVPPYRRYWYLVNF